MSKCIVCGKPLKSKETIEKGMGKTCAKVFATYDSSTQERLLQEYHGSRVNASFGNPEMVMKSQAQNLVEILKTNDLATYQQSMNQLIQSSKEPDRSLYAQQLWETEQGMVDLYQRERAKEPRLPETITERFKNPVYKLYRKQQMNLSPEQADTYLPAFKQLLQEEEVKEEEQIQEEMMSFGVEFLDDADYRIDPNDKELPEGEDREYYMNVLYSVLRDEDEFAYTRIHLEEANRESLYRIANLYYKLSKRYLPALKNLPRLSTFKEFNRANQDTWLRFHAVTRNENLNDFYQYSGGFYLQGPEIKNYLPNDSREKVNEIGLYLNENMLNDSYTTMGDHYKKDQERSGFGGSTHFAKVPDNIQYRDYIVVHETGHCLHDTLNFKSKTNKKLESYFQENRERIANTLSRYASVSVEEMVAESFAEFTLNPTPSSVSLEVMEILNEKFYSDPHYSTVDEAQARKVIKTAKFHKPSPEKEILQTLLKQ